MKFTNGTFGPMTQVQAIALLELELTCDALSTRLDKINKGYFQGPYDYPSQIEAETVFGKLQWVYDPAKYHTGIRSTFNHAERWLGQSSHGWTIAIVPHVAGPARCYSSEVTA